MQPSLQIHLTLVKKKQTKTKQNNDVPGTSLCGDGIFEHNKTSLMQRVYSIEHQKHFEA